MEVWKCVPESQRGVTGDSEQAAGSSCHQQQGRPGPGMLLGVQAGSEVRQSRHSPREMASEPLDRDPELRSKHKLELSAARPEVKCGSADRAGQRVGPEP